MLIMDEPTASLAKHETEALFELIDRLKARGIAIVYISHRMDEVYRIADRITILRDGNRLLTERLADITPAQIVEGIVGKELGEEMAYRERGHDGVRRRPCSKPRTSPPPPRVNDVSFTLTAGEILGLAGLMGSGRTELARVLFGIDAARLRRDHHPRPPRQPVLTATGHRRRSRADPGGPPRAGPGAGPLGAGEPAAAAAQEGAERRPVEQGQGPIARPTT